MAELVRRIRDLDNQVGQGYHLLVFQNAQMLRSGKGGRDRDVRARPFVLNVTPLANGTIRMGVKLGFPPSFRQRREDQ